MGIGIWLYLTYLLIIVAAISFIGGVILSLVNNKKRGLVAVGAVVGLLVIYGIGAVAAQLDPGDLNVKVKEALTAGTVKTVNGGIVLFYFLLITACLSLVGDMIISVVKNR